jgi:hypothetical protein
MNTKIMITIGCALFAAGILSTIGPHLGAVSAQNQNSGAQGADTNQTQESSNSTRASGNLTLRLHALLDAAIEAAQNNDTLGVLMDLSQISQGLAEINTPSSNATDLAAASNPETVDHRNATDALRENRTDTSTGTVAGDDPENPSDNPYSSFT